MVREDYPGWCSSADWKITVTEAHGSALSHSWGRVTHIESVPSDLGKIENGVWGDSLGWLHLQSGWVTGNRAQASGAELGAGSRLPFLPAVGLAFVPYRRQLHLLRWVVINNGGGCRDWDGVWLTGSTQPCKPVLSQCVPVHLLIRASLRY